MKYATVLKQELIKLAENYGEKYIGSKYANPNEFKNSSLIFNCLSYSFQKDSWNAISKNNNYNARTKKKHARAQTKDVLEMQSSNSSDVLAMNIFCHPDFTIWDGVKKLFQVKDVTSINFGYKAKVDKIINNKNRKDNTEIDIYLNENIFIECKLTEKDFTSKNKDTVEQYSEFYNVFHVDQLVKTETHYKNYQLIRNILAANQNNAQFILICDMRRPDLVNSFNQTVNCIKEEYFELRNNCKIIYWQNIFDEVGSELKMFLKDKYALNSY